MNFMEQHHINFHQRAPLWRATVNFVGNRKNYSHFTGDYLPVRYFLIQPFYVNGESMFQTMRITTISL